MKINLSLMPKGLRPLGIAFSISGLLLAFVRYYFNYKPDFLDLKVFALYSFYIEAKSMTLISNQMIEELAGFLLLFGLFLIAFTREREESEYLDALRLKAFIITAYLNLFYLMGSLLFFYGFGFVGALTFFMVYWLVAYILVFRYLLFQHLRRQ